jgi:tetratricopeptide (TPR) repeat protein
VDVWAFAKDFGKGAWRLATAWRRWGQEDRAEIEHTYKNELACLQEQLNEADSEEEKARIKHEIKAVRDEQRLFYRARRDLLMSKALVERMTPKGMIAMSAPQLPAPERETLRIATTLLNQLEAAKSFADRFLRANAFYAAGDYAKALEEYDAAVQLRPDDPVVLNNRGVTLHHLERDEEAFADFNRSLQLHPDHPGYLALRGGSLFLLERYGEALADLNRSLELRPDDPSTLSLRGGTLGHLNRYVEALADFNRSLELHPDDPIDLRNRGLTLTKLGRPKEALADLHRALELQPDEPCIVGSRALALVKLGQEERAFADFARALAPKPSHPDILYYRACALSVAGRWDESLHDLAEAIAGRSGYRGEARQDPDLEPVRSHPQWGPKFWELVGTED